MEVGEINAVGCSDCVGEMRSLQMDSAWRDERKRGDNAQSIVWLGGFTKH